MRQSRQNRSENTQKILALQAEGVTSSLPLVEGPEHHASIVLRKEPMETPESELEWGEIDPEKWAAIEREIARYWEVDAITNATDYLEMIAHFLGMNQSPWRWKWVVLATHQALYTFMVMALSKSAPMLTVMKNKQAAYAQMRRAMGWTPAQIADDMSTPKQPVTEAQVKKWLREDPKLISIWDAKRLITAKEPNTGEPHNPEGNDYLPWNHSRRLVLTPDEEAAIERLISDYRNEFEHFLLKNWSIDSDIFPPMITHVLRAIRFIALESNCIHYYRDGQEERVKAAIEKVQQHLVTAGPEYRQ